MHLGILTRSLPPHMCGLGGHSVCLANALRALEHDVLIIAGRGASGVGIRIIGDEWTRAALEQLRQSLESSSLDHLVLQFTPAAFSDGDWRVCQAIADFWRIVGARMLCLRAVGRGDARLGVNAAAGAVAHWLEH
jgi:hypothetical protein